MIEERTIEAVKRHSGVIDVLAGHVPGGLKREGGNSYRGHIPWRKDEKPSMTVSLKDGTWLWNDISQGGGGDIFQLLERWHGMAFPDAVEWWAQRLGVAVEKTLATRSEPLAPAAERLVALANLYAGAEELVDGTPAAEYLRKRGLLDAARELPVKGYTADRLKVNLRKYGLGRLNWWAEEGQSFLVYGSPVGGSMVVHRARLLLSQGEAKEKNFNTAHGHIAQPGELGLPALWPSLGTVEPESQVILTEGETDTMGVRTLVPGAKGYAIFGAAMFHPKGAEFQAIVAARAKVVLAMQTDEASLKCSKRVAADFESLDVKVKCLVPAFGVKDWADAVAVGSEPRDTIEEAGVAYGDDTLTRAYAELQRYSKDLRSGKIVHVPLPWPCLHWTLGRKGLPPGTVGLLAARTGAGKSLLSLCASLHAAEMGVKTYYLNTEMDLHSMMARIMGIKTASAEVSSMSDPSLMDEAMYEHAGVLNLPLSISPPDPISVNDALAIVTEQAKAKTKLIVVDHVGDLDCGHQKPYEALPVFAHQVRLVAEATGACVLLITHLRAGSAEDVLAFSQQMEHKVHYCLSVTRHAPADVELQGAAGVIPQLANMILTVRKNRYGASDAKIAMLLDADTFSLRECGFFKKWSKGRNDDDWSQ